MTSTQLIRSVLPLTVALAFALVPAALAQTDTTKPAAAKPAAKKPDAKPAPKPAAAAAAPAAGAALLGQYGDWGAYSATPGGKKVCFALAKPSAAQTVPPGRNRDPAYLFISSRPAEKVKDEVSVIIGYNFKPNFDATAESAPRASPCTLRTTAPGSRTRPRRHAWSMPCARARTW